MLKSETQTSHWLFCLSYFHIPHPNYKVMLVSPQIHLKYIHLSLFLCYYPSLDDNSLNPLTASWLISPIPYRFLIKLILYTMLEKSSSDMKVGSCHFSTSNHWIISHCKLNIVQKSFYNPEAFNNLIFTHLSNIVWYHYLHWYSVPHIPRFFSTSKVL